MRDTILVFSLGTREHSVTAVDRELNFLSQERIFLEPQSPQTGWSEIAVDELWVKILSAARTVIGRVGQDRLAGIAIVNSRETVVVWERGSGNSVYPAIASDDRRTEKICQTLKSNRKEPMLHYRTGLFLDPAFPATKIAWILDHTDGAQERARNGELASGTLDSWLLWKLTRGAVHATDPSNASRSLLYDLNTGQWEPQLLATFGVPAALLPRVFSSSGIFGESASELFGFSLPILAMAGDESAALFSQNSEGLGQMRVGYNQTLCLQTYVGMESMVQSNLLTNVAWRIGDRLNYMMEGSISAGGQLRQWLQHGIGLTGPEEGIEAQAQSVPDTQGVFFVPAFTGLGLPYFDPFARGTIFGLNPHSTRAHIIRAGLEGIANLVADIGQMVERATKTALQKISVDGTEAKNNFLMQFQADIFGVPVERPAQLETAVVGGAELAGLAVGFWRDREEMKSLRRIDRVFEPSWSEAERRQNRIRWQDAVERARGWERNPGEFI